MTKEGQPISINPNRPEAGIVQGVYTTEFERLSAQKRIEVLLQGNYEGLVAIDFDDVLRRLQPVLVDLSWSSFDPYDGKSVTRVAPSGVAIAAYLEQSHRSLIPEAPVGVVLGFMEDAEETIALSAMLRPGIQNRWV